ncbi:MAG: CPBP family glutamic-type intramembrane protease [Armatimonadota bacterium]
MACDDPAPEFQDDKCARVESVPPASRAAGREPFWSLVAGILLFLGVLVIFWIPGLERMRQGSAPPSWQLRLQTYRVEASLYASRDKTFPASFAQSMDVRKLAVETAEGWAKAGREIEDGSTRALFSLNSAALYGVAEEFPAARRALHTAANADPQHAAAYRHLAELYAPRARPIAFTPEVERLLAQVSSGPLLRARHADLRQDEQAVLAALQPGMNAVKRLLLMVMIVVALIAGILNAALILFVLRYPTLKRDAIAAAETIPAPVPWSVGTALAAVSSYLLLMRGIDWGLALLFPSGNADTRTALSTLAYILSAILVIGGLLLSLGKKPWDWSALGWRQTPRGLGYGLLILIIAFPLIWILTLISGLIFGGNSETHPLIPDLIGTRSIWLQLYLLLMVAVVAPLVEETLFRGILFRALNTHMTLWAAALLSGVLFALVHVQLVAILPITALGVLFALLAQRSRSLLPSAAAHAGYNGFSWLLLILYGWALQGPGG